MNKKKLLALLMALVMTFSLVPVTAFADGNVARVVGGEEYATLQDAIDNAESGSTIELLANIYEECVTIREGQNITLNLNDHSVTYNDTPIIVYGKLTVEDVENDQIGSITSNNNCGIAVCSGGELVFNGGEVTAQEMAVLFSGPNAKGTINGGSFAAIDNAVFGTNGSTGRGGNAITINDGVFSGTIQTEGYVACGIYAANNDTWNVNGGQFYITGGAGIVARAGVVNVGGDVTISTSGQVTGRVGDSQVGVPCSAIVFDSRANYPGLDDSSIINISGGNFNSYDDDDNPVATVNEVKGETAGSHISISGGEFFSDPGDSFIANGYAAVKKHDEDFDVDYWTVDPVTYVAQIGSTKYETLAEAVTAAQPDDIIELIADDDVSLANGAEVVINKSLTINGNGNTIYGTPGQTGTNDIFITGSGTVNINDLKVEGFGYNHGTDAGHAPIYVSTSFTGTVNLTDVSISQFNRGGMFLYGGSFNVEDCYIDCANSRSGAFTKGIEIKGSATGTISDTLICNMERSGNDSTAGIEIYGYGSVEVNDCTILSDVDDHTAAKATYGIVSSRVGEHDPSGGSLVVNNTLTETTNAAISVADSDEYGPVNNYSITVNGCSFDNYIATWSATSSITINSGDFAQDVYADAGTIIIRGGEFTNFAPDTGTTGSIIISGGTFDDDPAEFVAEGYKAVDNGDGIWTVQAKDYVAQIGNDKYETLADAIAAARDGATASTNKTITLLENIELTSPVEINWPRTLSTGLTIDLNDHNITATNCRALWIKTGYVTLKGTGTISSVATEGSSFSKDSSVIRVGSTETTPLAFATLEMDEGVTVSTTYCYGISIFGNNTGTNGQVLVCKGIVTANDRPAISGNGTSTLAKTKITIEENATVSATNEYAIYHPQAGTLTVKGTVSGQGGVEMKAGTLALDASGVITATGTASHPGVNNNGTSTSGYAIALVENNGYKGGATANISKGTINGTIGKIVDNEVDSAKEATLSVSGGSFNSKVPEEYCASGYEPSGVGSNGRYTVQVTKESGVASITRGGVKTYYLKVTDALSAAQDGETVVLEKDYSSNLPSSSAAQLTVQKSITLDLNGHTLEHTNGKNALYVYGSSGKIPNLTVTGTGTIKSNATAIKAGAYAVVALGSGVTVTGNRGVEIGGGNTTFTSEATITGTEAGIFVAGSGTSNKIVNITGGSVSGGYGIYSNQAATVNVSAGTVTGTNAAIALNGYQEYGESGNVNTIKLNVTGGKVEGTGEGAAISASGNENDGNYEMNLSGGTISAEDVAIYHCNDGVLNVSDDVSITGATAIYQKSGTMNITGGTINGNGAAAEYSYNGNGANATGDAIVIDNCGYPGGEPNAKIKDATIASTNGKQIGYYVYNGSVEGEVLANTEYTLNTNPVNKGWLEYAGDVIYSKTIGELPNVAKINETDEEYLSLEDAFKDVKNGQTITLLNSVELKEPLNVDLGQGKSVILDLGGLTLTGRTNLKSGELTIQNGTVDGGELQALNVYGSSNPSAENYSVLNLESGLNVNADVFAVCLFGPTYSAKEGYGAVINTAADITTDGNGREGAIFVSGNLGQNFTGDGDMNNKINITGGEVRSYTDCAIALNGLATVTISGDVEISGNTAIAVKRGTLHVTGGDIFADGEKNYPGTPNNNGTEMTGAAISISDTYNTYGPLAVTISGNAVISSNDADAVYMRPGTYSKGASISISGGTFSTQPDATYVASGYEAVAIDGDWYQVGEKTTTIAVTTDSEDEDITPVVVTNSDDTKTLVVKPVADLTADENKEKTTKIKLSDLANAAHNAISDDSKEVKIITGLSATQAVNGAIAPQTVITDESDKVIFEAVAKGGQFRIDKKVDENGSYNGQYQSGTNSKADAIDYVDLRLQFVITLPEGVSPKDDDTVWSWTLKYGAVERTVKGVNYLPVSGKANTYTSNVVVTNIPVKSFNSMDFSATLNITFKSGDVTYTISQSAETPLTRDISEMVNGYIAGTDLTAKEYANELKKIINN